MQKKVVLIGGPGTGKSSVLEELNSRNYFCMPEVSREVTLEAQKQGIDQLFLEDPLLFSQKLLEGRERQFLQANETDVDIVFFDRGIPDVYAYLEYSKTNYPSHFVEKCHQYRYTTVFLFLPWKEIYVSDNERYESYNQLKEIDIFLQRAYKDLGYEMISVPFGTVEERTDFILTWLKNN